MSAPLGRDFYDSMMIEINVTSDVHGNAIQSLTYFSWTTRRDPDTSSSYRDMSRRCLQRDCLRDRVGIGVVRTNRYEFYENISTTIKVSDDIGYRT